MSKLLPATVTVEAENPYPEYNGLTLEIKLPTISDAVSILSDIKKLNGDDKLLKEKLKGLYVDMTVKVSLNGESVDNFSNNPVVMSCVQDAVIGIITRAASLQI